MTNSPNRRPCVTVNPNINPIVQHNGENDYDSDTELDYIGNTHNYFCSRIRNCVEYIILFFT